MQYVKAAVGSDLSALGAPCVYDAEAIYALRETGRRRLTGQPMAEADSRALIDDELGLARGCAAVLAVSEAERQLFAAAGIQNVSVVSHAVEPRPTPSPFERRRSDPVRRSVQPAFSERRRRDVLLSRCVAGSADVRDVTRRSSWLARNSCPTLKVPGDPTCPGIPMSTT